jgi:hypothetical protein
MGASETDWIFRLEWPVKLDRTRYYEAKIRRDIFGWNIF